MQNPSSRFLAACLVPRAPRAPEPGLQARPWGQPSRLRELAVPGCPAHGHLSLTRGSGVTACSFTVELTFPPYDQQAVCKNTALHQPPLLAISKLIPSLGHTERRSHNSIVPVHSSAGMLSLVNRASERAQGQVCGRQAAPLPQRCPPGPNPPDLYRCGRRGSADVIQGLETGEDTRQSM